MTIEQTLKSDDRMRVSEAIDLIAKSLKISKNTVQRREIYAPDFAQCRAANKKFFKRAELINALNRRLG